jgi:hypothetical protein
MAAGPLSEAGWDLAAHVRRAVGEWSRPPPEAPPSWAGRARYRAGGPGVPRMLSTTASALRSPFAARNPVVAMVRWRPHRRQGRDCSCPGGSRGATPARTGAFRAGSPRLDNHAATLTRVQFQCPAARDRLFAWRQRYGPDGQADNTDNGSNDGLRGGRNRCRATRTGHGRQSAGHVPSPRRRSGPGIAWCRARTFMVTIQSHRTIPT